MVDVAERSARLQKVATEMDSIIREIGPKLVRLAHLREETRTIMAELGGAGVEPQD